MPIYLPRDDEHTFDNSPKTILIGNICYEKDAASAIEPDALWENVVDEFDNCDDCEATSIEYEPCTIEPVNCANCSDCDSGSGTLTVVVSGFTGSCSVLNGSYVMTAFGNCHWEDTAELFNFLTCGLACTDCFTISITDGGSIDALSDDNTLLICATGTPHPTGTGPIHSGGCGPSQTGVFTIT